MKDKKYEYGCAMLNVAFPLSGIHSYIKRNDVYNNEGNEYGLETEPHITLLYGLHSEVDARDITKALESVQFSKVRVFEASKFESELYDVLKFTVEGEGLVESNKALKKLPHTDTFKDYKPHLTIAYLKKGCIDYYISLLKNVDVTLYASYVNYSDGNGNYSKINCTINYI